MGSAPSERPAQRLGGSFGVPSGEGLHPLALLGDSRLSSLYHVPRPKIAHRQNLSLRREPVAVAGALRLTTEVIEQPVIHTRRPSSPDAFAVLWNIYIMSSCVRDNV